MSLFFSHSPYSGYSLVIERFHFFFLGYTIDRHFPNTGTNLDRATGTRISDRNVKLFDVRRPPIRPLPPISYVAREESGPSILRLVRGGKLAIVSASGQIQVQSMSGSFGSRRFYQVGRGAELGTWCHALLFITRLSLKSHKLIEHRYLQSESCVCDVYGCEFFRTYRCVRFYGRGYISVQRDYGSTKGNRFVCERSTLDRLRSVTKSNRLTMLHLCLK